MEKIFNLETQKKQKQLLLGKFINSKEKITANNNIISILSPGRANIIGEYTDYNMGFSLPIAIEKDDLKYEYDIQRKSFNCS